MTTTLAATNNAAQMAPHIHHEVLGREFIIRRTQMTFMGRRKGGTLQCRLSRIIAIVSNERLTQSLTRPKIRVTLDQTRTIACGWPECLGRPPLHFRGCYVLFESYVAVEGMPSARKPYPSDVSDDEWSLAVPYLTLMRKDADQREHPLREFSTGCVM